MLPEFLWIAIIAGFGLATVSGVLGCFVIWRKMAYFGDSLAHSALLGVALGFASGINISLSIVLICGSFAVLLNQLQRHRYLSTDTLLGIVSHAALSLGLIAIYLQKSPQLDLESYLFGEIFAINYLDIGLILGGGIAVLAVLYVFWSSLTLMTISEDLAIAEGVNTYRMNLLLMLLTTIVVAVSIRIVGALLITALLIIPAATARLFARSPEQMVLLAITFGWIAVALGLSASWHLDSPSGPSIVASAMLCFGVLLPFAQRAR